MTVPAAAGAGWCPLCGADLPDGAGRCPSCGLDGSFARPDRPPMSRAALLALLGGLAAVYLVTLLVVAVAR